MKHRIIYTEAQKGAVMHGDGPGIVFAGPGSGKTFVLTEHIFYMIYTLGINPNQILVITFTKAAAIQMEERFYQKSKEHLPITFKTFHAFFYQILSQNKMYMNKKIISQKEKNQIIKQIIYRFFSNEKDQVELAKEISAFLNSRYIKQELKKDYIYFTEEEKRKISMYYEEEKSILDRMDFTDLVYFCLEKCKHDTEFLKRIQEEYSYILIDEFQDITPPQYEIIKYIGKKKKNIFVVGDEDQSIYKFCGSKADCMKTFIYDYPNLKKYYLNTNFRSTKEIITCSQNLIKHNLSRVENEIELNKENAGKVSIIHYRSKDDEYAYIANQILLIIDDDKMKDKIKSIGIISRTKSDWNQIQVQLEKQRLYIKNINQNRNALQSEYIDDLMAYLNFSINGYKRKDLIRIINKPVRYLSPNYFRDDKIDFVSLKNEFKNQNRILQEIIKLENQIKFIRSMSIHGAIHFIRKGIGYDIYAKEVMTKNKENYIVKMKDLDLLEERAKHCKNMEELHQFTFERSSLNKCSTNSITRNQNIDINLLTMHSSKGLEFDAVFIVDVNEGTIPHRKASRVELVEEERRLLYVGITRAKKEIYILYIADEKNRNTKSRFIDECIGIK